MEFQGRQEARKSAQLPDSLINHTLRKVYDDQGNEITEREPLPKITKDDEADNRKSLYRKLAEPLYLIVKKPKEMEMPWQFPTAYHQGDQTIRQTAEKGLKASCGEDLMTYFLGNAPVAHLNLKTEKGDTQVGPPAMAYVY